MCSTDVVPTFGKQKIMLITARASYEYATKWLFRLILRDDVDDHSGLTRLLGTTVEIVHLDLLTQKVGI